MALNLNALKGVKGELDARSGGSEGFLNTKDLTPEGIIFRLLPPPPTLNGIFHLPVQKWMFQVNGKWMSIIDPTTFSTKEKPRKSPIQEEVDMAKQSDDDGVLELVNAINPNTHKPALVMQEEAWMAGLVLEYKLGAGDAVVGYKVVDDRAKVFQCGKTTLLSEMIKIATTRPATSRSKDCEDGIADRVKGSNMLLSKEGKGKQTTYAAVIDEELEISPNYYVNIPDVYEIAKAQCKLPSYQRAIIRQYLYGEPVPPEIQAKEDKRAEEAKAALDALKVAVKAPKKAVAEEEDEAPAPKPKKKAAVEEEDEEATPKPKAKKPALDEEDDEPAPNKKVAAPPRAKHVVLDDEDDEPQPAKKPKKTALDDDDDDAPIPVIKPKAKAPAPAPAAKAKSRSIMDELDLDED